MEDTRPPEEKKHLDAAIGLDEIEGSHHFIQRKHLFGPLGATFIFFPDCAELDMGSNCMDWLN